MRRRRTVSARLTLSTWLGIVVLPAIISVALLPSLSPADDQSAPKPAATKPGASEARTASQEALAKFNALIGGWRGAAQPVRNSSKGAWTEKGNWVWDLKQDPIAIRYEVEGGKLLKEAVVTYDPEKARYKVHATLPDKSTREYTGKLDDKKLVVETAAEGADTIHRLTITQLNDKRTLVLFEQRPTNGERFTRVAEVGYTRDGTRLAVEGADGPECIVTGGKGTIMVSYKGKTYWVCCTGCRDAFNDDPEGVLAEAAARAEKKKAEAK